MTLKLVELDFAGDFCGCLDCKKIYLNSIWITPQDNIKFSGYHLSPMIKINRKLMSEKNINLATPLVITNKDDVDVELNEIRGVTIESVIMTVKKK